MGFLVFIRYTIIEGFSSDKFIIIYLKGVYTVDKFFKSLHFGVAIQVYSLLVNLITNFNSGTPVTESFKFKVDGKTFECDLTVKNVDAGTYQNETPHELVQN